MKLYSFLLSFHSLFRWLVLSGILYALFRGIRGWRLRTVFTSFDNKVRHITATLAHVQLVLGYCLFFVSPRPQWSKIHLVLMTASIVLITIGSAAAKRRETDMAKFRTMTVWYGAALLIIFLAVPWPWSPLAQRPLFRTF
jgi:hypothetical protein